MKAKNAGPSDRRGAIVKGIAQGTKTIAALADLTSVSEMTIRRDLELLEHEGVVLRVRGGAVLRISRSFEPPREQRATENSLAKARIGRAAAALIDEGETGVLDVGTTPLAVAEALRGRRALTLVTASLPAALALSNESDIRVMVTGGMMRPGELSLTGARAMAAFTDYNCDVAFVGVAGLDLRYGLTEYNVDDADVKRAMIVSAKRCVVLADASKLGVLAFAGFATLDAVDSLVTDAADDHPVVRGCLERGIEVVTC